uniref:FANCI solenoid 4 domain-containing protein n=2 Tax=Phaeomonas parva TaxID=124430 RepID=A0A7S1U906_9STRA|mmetsp:Transcript_37527/g.117319  ORF Transcript_37527/g.117319 Transcript_37527/m.117319 type:complete len:138 (+) Transcript_37527:55-468(+)
MALKRVFKLVTNLVKQQIASKEEYLSEKFEHLLDAITRKVAVDMDAFLLHIEQPSGAKASKQKLSRELKLIPQLIYEAEQLDVHLLKMLKRSKGQEVDTSRWLKRRRARDFRFKGKENAKGGKRARAAAADGDAQAS